MRRLILKATVLLSVVCLASCGGDERKVTPQPQPQAETTVMVYMVGSNLESDPGQAATGNLREMLRASLPSNANIVIETGGAKVQNNSASPVPNWINVKRHVLTSAGIQQLADLGTPDMGAPATLSDFIAWAGKTYPATNYKLVLWDHGGGWHGFGGDENKVDAQGNKSMLSLPTLTSALQTGTASAGIHFDLIGFDACLMATVEVADALKPYADYMLASQEIEPGSGWDWTTVIASAKQDPKTFGKTVADSYVAKQTSEKQFGTLSLLDLSKVASVQRALESWSGSVLTQVRANDSIWPTIVWKRAVAMGFGGTGSAMDSRADFDMVDLKQFSQGIADTTPGSDAVASAVSQAVVYSNATANYSSASGLSTYFPSRSVWNQTTSSLYQKLAFSPTYRTFVKNYVAAVADKPHVMNLESTSGGGNIVGNANSDAGLVFVDNLLFSNVDANGLATMVGSMPIYHDNVNFRAKTTVTAPLSGNWLTLNGYPVVLGFVASDDDTRYWGVPIELNGDLTYLIYVQANTDVGQQQSWTAIGTASSLKDPVPRMVSLPKASDKIRILAAQFDTTTARATSLIAATPEFSTGNFDLTMRAVPAGYKQALMLTDGTWALKVSDVYPRAD